MKNLEPVAAINGLTILIEAAIALLATQVQAAVSVNTASDNPRHEIETILTDIAEGKF